MFISKELPGVNCIATNFEDLQVQSLDVVTVSRLTLRVSVLCIAGWELLWCSLWLFRRPAQVFPFLLYELRHGVTPDALALFRLSR